MAYPSWFNPDYYAEQKVIQMNAMQYKGLSEWGGPEYEQELNSFRDINGQPIPGETTDDKAYQNFLATNGSGYNTTVVTRADLNVSPNEYFDVSVYVANLAAYAARTNMEGAPEGGWTPEAMLLHLYNDLRMSAWDHYTNVGMYAGINPSNEFDTNDYLQQRREAMNKYENPDGTLGWNGNDSWSIMQVQEYLQSVHLNPIMDYYGAGQEVFKIDPKAPATPTEVEDGWTPWTVPPPFNPYEQNVTAVEMSADQTAYSGDAGVNTRFEAIWGKGDGDSQASIAPGYTIAAGANAYNTLAITMNEPWPGFQSAGAVNVGRVELIHGETSPGTPYTFDARNIPNLEWVDIMAGADDAKGTGAISLKNLGGTVKRVNIHNLDRMNDTQTQITGIEFAEGANSGSNDSLIIGVANVGGSATEGSPAGLDAPAPIALTGVEHITLNAMQGNNFVNLQSVSGAQTLSVTGGGNIKVSSVPNGIRSYDASGASGRTNILTSDLNAATTVKGGIGVDTITLTQSLTGTPISWSGVEALAVSPGVAVNISAANIQGLSDLWVDSKENVVISNLSAPDTFTIRDTFNGSTGNITVNGNIRNLVFSNANYSAETGTSTAPVVSSNVSGNASINSVGEGTVAGKYTFSSATGELGVNVGENATLGPVVVIAPETNALNAQITGKLASGARIQAVDNAKGGSIVIDAANGIELASPSNLGQITLDADGAASMEISTGANFKLASDSSLKNLESMTIKADGANANFDASWMKSIPNISSVSIDGGGNVALPTLGSSTMTKSMQIVATEVNDLQLGGLQAGGNANITAEIEASGVVSLGNVVTASGITIGSAEGDVHLTIAGTDVLAYGAKGSAVTGADIFMNLSGVTGNAFADVTGGLTLSARESINYTGADGQDMLTVNRLGSAVPSSINLGSGADSLTVARGAVSPGQLVTMTVDLGDDALPDRLYVNSQSSGKLGLYVENFHQGTDILEGFNASTITRAQGQSLLSSFGVANVAEGSLQLLGFGSGRGVLYDGDLYAFNGTNASGATTMVVLAGVNENVTNLGGAPIVNPEPEATA